MPHLRSRVAALAALAALTALTALAPACGGSSGGGHSGITQIVACPGALDCGVTVAHGYVGGEATVEAQIRPAVSAACQRLHAECAYVCASPFAVCGDTVAQCVEDNVKRYLDDLDYPVVDATLAARCRVDIQAAACTDIPPSTPACDEALVEGCRDDRDNLGAPYSFLAAPALAALPSELSIHLCDGVEEWFTVTLARGESLRLHAREPEPSFGHLWAELLVVGPGDDEPTDLQSKSMRWGDEEPLAFDAVDTAGSYLVRLELSSVPTLDLTLTVEAVAAAP
ncbi:MAG: hypothetical protein KC635_02665 [Myxococcales bacterium]|nr:hypothetical protein [Myxococcales bacterium]MCB9736461.1 hypothetical protein [Deltaproteobacteria bacterium]